MSSGRIHGACSHSTGWVAFTHEQPKWKRYAALVTGKPTLRSLLAYEFLTCTFGGIPGALGLALRSRLYRSLFRRVGRALIVGRGVVIRHADKIDLGDNVTIDDYAVVDGRGAGRDGLVIGNNAIIGRGAIIQAKLGSIRIGDSCNVGAQTVVISQGDAIEIADWCQIAGGCKISGGRFRLVPNAEGFPYERESGGPIRIGTGCFLGMGVIVTDGATIGDFCTIGSGAIINQAVPSRAILMPRPPIVVGSTVDRDTTRKAEQS